MNKYIFISFIILVVGGAVYYYIVEPRRWMKKHGGGIIGPQLQILQNVCPKPNEVVSDDVYSRLYSTTSGAFNLRSN